MPLPLRVVLLTSNVAGGPILRGMEAGPLPSGDDSIGLRLIFHTVDAVLLAIQAGRLALGQLAAGDA